MAKQPSVKTIINRIKNLPLIDSAVYKIISLLNNPDSNYDQIVEKLSPGLAIRFLSIVNTDGGNREVRSINHAVKLLGYSKMKDILITSILMDHFTKRLAAFDFDKFLKQAQFCATVANILGEILDFDQQEDLFTVATLQNLGKLVIAVYFKAEHKEIIALKISQGLSTAEAETKILGVNHAEIGAMVLQRFGIPREICDAVRFHDRQSRDAPAAMNSQLPYIARAATEIVAKFSLPEEIEPRQLATRLKNTIETGKKNYRQALQREMRFKGYEEMFPSLLVQATDLVYKDLKRHLPERTSEANMIGDPDLNQDRYIPP